MILVTSPFKLRHVVALTLTFHLLQGQSCCRAGDHNSPNLLVKDTVCYKIVPEWHGINTLFYGQVKIDQDCQKLLRFTALLHNKTRNSMDTTVNY